MTKLKTLKDMQKDKGNCDSLELRQEAIKWIKYDKEFIWKTPDEWIKHFFNITAKELK